MNPEAYQEFAAMEPRDEEGAIEILNRLDWTSGPEMARRLQDSVLNSTALGVCIADNVSDSGILILIS